MVIARRILLALAGLAAFAGVALAQPGPGPGPVPTPSPWVLNGNQVYLAGQQCITLPAVVTGGCEGNNTINAAGLFVNGVAAPTVASFSAAAPITYNSGTAQFGISLDSNFATVSSSLALASIASGNLIANSTAGSAEPTTTTLTSLLDRAMSSTSGNFLVRGASTWAGVAMGGDATMVAGGSVTVTRINGVALGSTTATAGNILIGSGTQWVTQAMTGAVSLTSGGVTALTASAFANPTGSVGLSAVNGSATTAMRSDGAPALSQAISPTWTGQHQWTVARSVASAAGANLDDVVSQAATTTITGTTTITKFNKVSVYQPTFTDGSTVTISDAASLYVDNAPLAAGSVTLTRTWAIRVGAGNVSFPGSGNVLGTITSGVWNGTAPPLANGGTNNSLTASNGGVVYSDASKLNILAGTATANQCLLSGSNAAPSWGSCSGGAAVTSVTNSDGTLTISPTTGAVVASIALGHANTWTAAQSFNVNDLVMNGSTSGTTKLNANATAGTTTQTFQAANGIVADLDVADQTVTGGANVTTQTLTTGNVTIDCGTRPLQQITNGGAFTITAPANDGSCVVKITNNASAGAVTFSGFTVGSATGASLDTVNTHVFTVWIFRVGGTSGFSIFANQ